MFSWMFHTWYGSRMGTRFMTFLFHHMFDSIHHLSTSVLVHLLLWWVKLLDYQVNKYNKWRQSWFWARNVQLFHFGYRFAGTDPPEESPSQPEDGSQFIAPIFWRRVFQWLMPTVLAGTTTKTTPKPSLKILSLRRCWVCFTTRDSTSTERCSTSTKWTCGHPSSYATMTLENGVPLAEDGNGEFSCKHPQHHSIPLPLSWCYSGSGEIMVTGSLTY